MLPILDAATPKPIAPVSVDWGFVVLAAVAAVVVGVVLWCGEPLRSRRQIGRALLRGRLGGALVLLYVVLPNALPLDHALSPAHQHMSGAEASVHASHCHAAPGSCSDLPIASGPGQFLHAQGMLPVGPAQLARMAPVAVAIASINTVTPDTPPPQA